MIDTPFTRGFGLKYPIALAPVPEFACGQLAAAVSDAGGLGLIGGGGHDADWIAAEFEKTGETAVGCGLRCDAITESPEILTAALNGRPRAVYLSHGDPRPHAKTLKAGRVRVICEAETLSDAQNAVEAGADVIVAKGTDAGGQPASRTMFNLVPDLADFIRTEADDTVLLAFGGIVDARTLSAVIALGADGAVMASRLIISSDGRASSLQLEDALKSNGDDAAEAQRLFSQGIGLVRDAPSVADILDRTCKRAERILSHSIRTVIK